MAKSDLPRQPDVKGQMEMERILSFRGINFIQFQYTFVFFRKGVSYVGAI